MEIGRIERRKAFLRTLLSLAICLSLLLTVKAFAAQTIGPLSISLSDKNLVATYEGVRASKILSTGKDGTVDVVVDGGNSFTATVKSAHKYVGSGYLASNMTITLKNGYDTPARLKFSYTITDGKGTVTVDQINESGEVTRKPFNKEIPGGGDITIKIVSSANKVGCNSGVVLKIEDIELEQVVTTATTTFIPGEHGSYTVNGTAVERQVSHTQKSTDKYNLNAQADDGYVFLGWLSWTKPDKTDKRYISTNNPESIGITSDCTIQPVFIPEDSAQFSVGSEVFYDLNAANAYALTQTTKTIVLIKSGTIPVDQYKIDSGVTLLIPYSSSTAVHTTKPSNSDTVDIKADRSAYRTLTVPSGTTINVYGALNVDGQISKNKSLPTGQYGLITLESGAKINLSGKDEKGNDKGGSLYCWGYINGDGLVIANSGANVYESFQLTGWRGGGASQTIVGDAGKKRVFPINQYYIQNVEAALQFHYGAKEYVYASVEVTIPIIGKQQYDVTTEFISMNAGMFRLQPGCTFTKKYIPATDRMLFEVDGDFTIGTMALNFTTIISLKTEQYDLPINSNFSVDIRSGTTTIAPEQNIALLPGAKFTVSHGAEFVAESNMYVYDRDEWIGKNYAYGGDLRVVGYSTTNGTTTMRTAADLVDATIDVNGKLRISGTKGGIYTTKNPNDPDRGSANIFSSEGTGQVIFDIATKDEATAYQVRQKGNDVEGYDEIPCDSAQLRNGDGTYTETAGAQAGWTYKYDTVAQRWYRFRVTYQFNGQPIGEDLITTDTSTWDVSFADGDLVGTVTEGTANTPTIADGKLTVSGVASDCTINIKGVAASYAPYFVLNEHQYGVYRSYGGAEIAQKAEIGGKTYYVVKACGTLEFGSALEAPSNEAMGVSEDNHNSITWFLEDVTTGAQQFMNTVPSGKDKGGPVYIYGIYNGAVAYNSYTGAYYTNLKDAIVALPVTGSATLTMYANCGTFEDESKTASYSLSANITFDVNGKEVWGSLVNNGTMTLDLQGGSVRYITGATAGSSTYRGAATIVNNGTMTIQDSKGGGVISTDAVCDDNVRYDLKNHTSAIRNLGKLTMEGVSVAVDQSVNDWATAVMNYDGGVITSMNNCSVISKKGYGITNYGGTIQTISGGTINGGDAATAGRYGIQNRNIRSGSGTEAAPYVISKLGTIDTISGVTVYVYQNGLINYATVNRITGNTNITTTADSAIRNQAGWYYDTQVTKGTTTEANNVKTTVYTYDTVNFPTIKEISGNVTVTANGSYAIWNSGNIEKISGDMNGNGVLITRPNGNYTLENSGYIGEISGKVTIYSSGAYVLMQNIWGSSNARQIGQTYIQKDVDKDGTYTSTGDIREYNYEYTAPVIDKIGGDNSEIAISGTSNALYNYGTINTIAGGVTVTARTGSAAAINGSGGQQTIHSVRTNLGFDNISNRYETRCEDERTYYRAKIGSISGDITIQSLKSSGALVNGGTIDSIGSDVKLQATSSVLQNNSYTFEQQQYVYLGYHATSVFGTSNEAGRDYAYTAAAPVITLIDGPTIQATSGDHAIVNGGTIGTIQNATISAKGAYAINNSSNIITERKIFKDSAHTTAYALTELFDAFFTKDAATGKYTSVAASATPNHVDSYGVIPTITVIGAGNTISATKQTIYNRGEITNIDSGSATKTSITATDQGTSGQAIYNFSALAGTKTFTDGSTGVDGDYKTPAHIGIIRNVNVTAAYRAIQNGDAGNYLNVIDEIGANTDARATGNVKDGAAVYNADKNAQIKSITNGTYTAATAGHYAVHNASTTYAIAITDGYFKGGLSSSANRDHAIYQPDDTKRQTYPKGYTLSTKTNDDGYYYIVLNRFTIRYDGNGSTSDPVTGSVVDQTESLTVVTVQLKPNGFTRENWEFVGWALDKNTGAGNVDLLLTAGSTVTLKDLGTFEPGDVLTLYAIWKPAKTYSVTVGWSGDLVYNYQPNVYQWNPQKMCYELKTQAYWDGDYSVTITNAAGQADNTKYGTVNVGIAYANTGSYTDFSMKYYDPVTQKYFEGTDSSKNLAEALRRDTSVTAKLQLIGPLPSGMVSGTKTTIGKVTLTLTTAD